jgi:ferritin-like protein
MYAMDGELSRGRLLARGGEVAATVVAASAFGGLAARASAAAPDGDLAYARLLVALELLSLDFYTRAIGAGGGSQLELRRGRAAERRHYDVVADVLTDAGQVPATAQDIDFSYPRGSFASSAAVARLGVRLESLSLGAYLGAVRSLQTPLYREHAARAAASEAQHLSVFAGAVGGRRLGPPMPAALSIDRVSNALDAYTS